MLVIGTTDTGGYRLAAYRSIDFLMLIDAFVGRRVGGLRSGKTNMIPDPVAYRASEGVSGKALAASVGTDTGG